MAQCQAAVGTANFCPADIFTACLTTPIRMLLRWALHTGRVGVTLPRAFRILVDRLPGKATDKKSPLEFLKEREPIRPEYRGPEARVERLDEFGLSSV